MVPGPTFDRKLAFFAALSALSCSAVLGGLAYWLADRSLAATLRTQAQANAQSIASRVSEELRAASSRARSYATGVAETQKLAFATDADLMALTVYQKPDRALDGMAVEDRGWIPSMRWMLPTSHPSRLTAEDLADLDLKHPIDGEVLAEGQSEAVLGYVPGMPVFLRVAAPLGERKASGYSQAVVVELKLGKIQPLFAHQHEVFNFLADARDEFVIASDGGHFVPSEDLSKLAIMQQARESVGNRGDLEYAETPDGPRQLAGYQRVPGTSGLVVVSQMPRALVAAALSPYALAVGSVSLVFCVLFGLSMGWLGGRFAWERSLRHVPAPAPAPIDAPAAQAAVHSPYQKVRNASLRELFDRGKAKAAGQRFEATVLHAHLHGIDRLSEDVDAEELLKALHEFNQKAAKAVESRAGILDSLHGGSVVALWSVPQNQKDSVSRALEAAAEIRAAASELATQLASHKNATIRLGMGVHAGTLAAGELGIEGSREYSAVGTAIEVAGRIQQFTDQFGTDLLVTGTAAKLAGKTIALEQLTPGDDQTPALYEIAPPAQAESDSDSEPAAA